MSRYLFVFALMMCCLTVNADGSRDPFLQKIELGCQEQTDLLNMQIQVWQFRGSIQRVDYQQLWLSSESDWLAITDNNVPHVLFPWEIETALSDKILWRANLPEYCNDKVLWTMPLTK